MGCNTTSNGLAGNSFISGTSSTVAGAPIVDAGGVPIPGYYIPETVTPTSGSLSMDFGTAQSQIFHNNFPVYSGQVTLSLPLRNRANQADNIHAQLVERQFEAQVQQTKNTVLLDVRNTTIAVEQGRAQVQAASKARELQQQTFDAEQKKYQLGASTVYNVILTQRDLITAQGTELRVLANLAEAKANYERALGRTLEVNNVTIARQERDMEKDTLIPGTRTAKCWDGRVVQGVGKGGRAGPELKRAGCESGLAVLAGRLLLTGLSHSIIFVVESIPDSPLFCPRRLHPGSAIRMSDASDIKSKSPTGAGNSREPSEAEKEWEQKFLEPTLRKSPERQKEFTTTSSYPIRRLYTAADLAHWDAARDLGFPGEPPYTRGIHPTMYRTRLWTMRQFAGFGTAEDTNERFRYLLAHGQTGLSTAFDLPTLMGYDSDHELSEGEVGKCGVAISSLADMEVLFDQIPLADVTTSMTINSPAAVIWAMYLAVAEKQGADWKKISGTLQNDILKEYIAQKEYIYPPEPSMRLVIDTFEFGMKHTPKFNVISISGYHIREAGSTAIRNWRSRSATAWNTWSGPCVADCRWMNSRRSCRSFLMRTMISSRKLASTAPRAASGTRP